MSVLGTMMLRAGLLSEGQVAAVSEHAVNNKSSEVDAILELGLADEDTLVAFLTSKLMIPRVRISVLERIDQVTLSRLPALVAWEHLCMPVSADELGNLTVVMADPTNKAAIEAIAEHTGAYLIRAISSVSDLRRALERHFGSIEAVRERAAAQVHAPPSAQITQSYTVPDHIAHPYQQQAPTPPTPAAAPANVPGGEGERATELALTPIRDEPAPSPYPSGIGIPDDDDDIPVRVGQAAAEEINSGPHEEAEPDPPVAPYMTQSPAPPAVPPPVAPYVAHQPAQAAPYMTQPSLQITAPYEAQPLVHGDTGSGAPAWGEPPPPAALPSQPEDDRHTRPTVVETQAPSRGPRRARAFTPWNPPLAGSGQPNPVAHQPAPTPEPAPYVAPEPEPAPYVAPTPEPVPYVAPTPAPELEIVPLSPEAFAQVHPRLEAAVDRDEVTTVLLDFLGAGFDRVILFVHTHNELRGHDARGKDLLVEAVRQVRIPTTGASMFSEAIERGSPYFGPVRSTHKIDQAFSQALGGLRGNVMLLPITIGSKVPLLLWAHGTNHAVDPRSITELSAAVSTALLRIIAALRKG